MEEGEEEEQEEEPLVLSHTEDEEESFVLSHTHLGQGLCPREGFHLPRGAGCMG